MNVVFTLDYTGTPDADDVLAARHIIFLENQRRTQQNVVIAATNAAAVIENSRRAAQLPPGTPIPIVPLLTLLPVATAAQIKASYLSLLLAQITTQHLSNTALAKSITGIASRFTDAERQQIFANLSARLNSGESAANIITDTAS